MLELTFQLRDDAADPLYIQLYLYIKEEIVTGRIAAGDKLPTVRTLSASLGISRTPVALAYEQLLAEGYVTSKPRTGLYAAALDPAAARPSAARKGSATDAGSKESLIKPTSPTLLRAYHAPPGTESKYDFGYGTVDLDRFPLTKWKRLLNRCFLPENSRVLLYGDYEGEPELRKEISEYVHQIRGVHCSPEQVIIGAGTYHSLDLLLQLIHSEVTTIAAEAAVNDGIRAMLERTGLTIAPLELEQDGVKLEDVYSSGAQAVYLTPSHQFPYGMTLSVGKRLQLLEWASQTGAYLIENDYDGEFRYSGRPIPALQGLDNNGRVVYVGTFSKALIPSLRLSYLILPPALLERFRSRKHSYDQLASPIFQKTLQLFMESGDFERHMRKMRNVYGGKHDQLVSAIRAYFGHHAEIIGSGSGLHLLIRMRTGLNEQELVHNAKLAGVHVYPTSVYALSPELASPSTVLLGFGGLKEADITAGIARLSTAWQ